MKITAQQRIENKMLKDMIIDLPIFEDHIHTEMSISIGQELRKYPKLFTKTLSEKPFDNTTYELQVVVISTQTFRELMEVAQARLNRTEFETFREILNEKL